MMKLKHLFFTLVLGACALIPLQRAHAQSTFRKGSQTLGLSLSLTMGHRPFWVASVPPIGLSYEYGVLSRVFSNGKGSLGIGAYGEYAMLRSAKHNRVIFYDSYLFLGGFASLHYEFVPKLDSYISPGLGVYTSSDRAHFHWHLITGTRYYVAPQFAIGLEYSWALPSLRLGLTYKF